MTVRGPPSPRAPRAPPCAMLPALAVYTPSASCDFGIDRIAFSAPRNLNEPIGCRFSSLIHSSTGTSTLRRISGVRTAVPRMRSRAALTSDGVGASMITRASELDVRSLRQSQCTRMDVLGGRQVLDRQPKRLEEGDFIASLSALARSVHELTQLGD